MSIIESSASGTPTVALKAPGIVDTIKNNYNGFLVNSMEEFNIRLLETIHRNANFAINSRSFAENFSWEKTTGLWEKVIREV